MLVHSFVLFRWRHRHHEIRHEDGNSDKILCPIVRSGLGQYPTHPPHHRSTLSVARCRERTNVFSVGTLEAVGRAHCATCALQHTPGVVSGVRVLHRLPMSGCTEKNSVAPTAETSPSIKYGKTIGWEHCGNFNVTVRCPPRGRRWSNARTLETAKDCAPCFPRRVLPALKTLEFTGRGVGSEGYCSNVPCEVMSFLTRSWTTWTAWCTTWGRPRRSAHCTTYVGLGGSK